MTSKHIQNMPIRLRAIIIVIATNVIIILFSVSVGIWFVQGNIKSANETDLTLVADVADHFISGEIDFLRLQALNIAHSISEARETEWPGIAAIQGELYPEFIGMAVFDAESAANPRVIFSTGEIPAPLEVIEDTFIQKAFGGHAPLGTAPWRDISFSSTYPSSIGMVFYLAAPLPEYGNRILVLTLPGMHFSDRFNQFVIWQTGHIFMADSDGYMIANMREVWVQTRINFLILEQTNREEFGAVAAVLRRVVNGETGVGYFPMAGVPRLCSFRPVSASQEGWGMGIIAPLPESPFRNIDRGLIVVGLIALSLSFVASIFFSGLIIKPFEEKEVAETNSRYKSNFLATMSHEIRTPMNAITGMTELALREDMPLNVRTHLITIKQAGLNLISIINDILDFSKVEAGMLEIKLNEYMLSSLFNDTVSIIKMKLMEKPLRFYTNIDSKLPGNMIGDEARLRQIIINLLSNAVKYTDRGNISLSITEDKREGDKVWLRIVVTDTGHGIKKEDQKKLFGEFVQLDMNKGNIEGTGLGLAITKRLCAAMDGEISLESEYGKGSAFTVLIPQGIIGKGSFAQLDNRAEKKVLVYEGRRIYAQSLIWSLDNMQIGYALAKNDDEFTEALRREEWSYIFSCYGLHNNIKQIMENISFPGNRQPSLALVIEQGNEAIIPNVRFINTPVSTLCIADVLNGKDNKKDYSYGSSGKSESHFAIPRCRLLVVDDIATNLNVARGLLSLYKPTVDICKSGAEAIEFVKQRAMHGEDYDLVFMDHLMPGMNGIEATESIRAWEKENQENRRIPIVALTANVVLGMREMFIEKGFNDFLGKPIDMSRLDEVLLRWIPKEKIEKRIENSNKKLIILVDDEHTELRSGRDMLTEKYSVSTAPSAAILFKLLEKNRPALILLDTGMPEMDGYEAARILKSKPETKEIPVILITDASGNLDREKSHSLEHMDYVSKPFDPELLISCIEKNISQ